jgi:membrane protein required for colicin V production
MLAVVVGLTVGFFLAGRHYYLIYPYLASFIPNPTLAEILSFFLILIVIMAIFGLAGKLIKEFIRSLRLGWFDRALGLLAGVGIGGLLVMLGVGLIYKLWPQLMPRLATLRLTPFILRLGTEIGLIPFNFLKG